MSEKGRLLCLGVGPGDPELITVKAARLLQSAACVAYFAKAGRASTARLIADRFVPPGAIELPLFYPITTEVHFADPAYQAELRAFYAEATRELGAHLEAGRAVALLAEGDPMFYGSCMHLFVRLRDRFACEIVPGISGMAGAWSAARLPITWGDDVLSVVPATLPEPELVRRLTGVDAAVIMKLGRHLPKLRRVLHATGLLERTIYVAYATREGEELVRLVEKADDVAPYFALLLVGGQGRRP